MMGVDFLIDGLLASILVLLAVRILWVRNLFQAVVLFISFGLLMAMAWVRLGAPDIALAEAGIGAALTGVLLLDALHNVSWRPVGPTASKKGRSPPQHRWIVVAPLAVGLLALLLVTLAKLPRTGEGLEKKVAAALPETGVDHAITAVLLNIRSLDTFLELTVLLLGVVAVLCLRGTARLTQMPVPARQEVVVEWLLRVLMPLMVLVAVYLYWLGSFAPGGAFQAGIIVAAVIVLLWLTGRHTLDDLPGAVWKMLLVLGIGSFGIVAGGTLLSGRGFLEYPAGWAAGLILYLEFAAAVSIGVALGVLFLGLHPPGGGPGWLEEKK